VRIGSIMLGLVLTQVLATMASANLIVDISPNAGTSFRVGGPNSQVETMSWTQSGSYAGVSISALVGSEDGNPETVTAYLTTAVGPAAGTPITSATVSIPSVANDSAITPTTLFSGLTLTPGSYYLTLFNSDTTGNVNVRWARGTTATFGPGVSANGEFFANATSGTPNTTNPWQSTFATSNLYDNGFSVNGTPVPEPSTFVMASMSVVALGFAYRARRSRA